MTIVLALGKVAHDSQVLLDGTDITAAVKGVEVRAFVGERTQVTLYLLASVELTGDLPVTLEDGNTQ